VVVSGAGTTILKVTTRKTVISVDTISVDSKVDADTRISASTLESGR
jgi:hypothetical protein